MLIVYLEQADPHAVEVQENHPPDCGELAKENREQVCSAGQKGAVTSEANRPVESGEAPCYMPQPEDSLAGKKKGADDDQMGPIGERFEKRFHSHNLVPKNIF